MQRGEHVVEKRQHKNSALMTVNLLRSNLNPSGWA